MTKNRLPERLYYSLDKAAEKLGCDANDLIHWAANGLTELCIKIYAPPQQLSKKNDEWDVSLLINENTLTEEINNSFNVSSYPVVDGCHHVTMRYHYKTLTYRLHGEVKCYVDETTKACVDTETILFGAYGLFALTQNSIYRNELDLVNGCSILADSFYFPLANIANVEHPEFIDVHNSEHIEHGVINEIANEKAPLNINRNDLLITHDAVQALSGESYNPASFRGHIPDVEASIFRETETSPKTLAKVAELTNVLIKMIPAFKDIDLGAYKNERIKAMLEAESARLGVIFPDIHVQTLAKYLGRRGRGSM